MKNDELRFFFSSDECRLCGECIEACPEIGNKINNPSLGMKRLREGEYVPEILERCSSCMTCNVVCKYNANPYGLILYRWFERGQENGYPIRASMVMPLEPESAWSKITDAVTEKERHMLDLWSDINRVSAAKNVMFAGCNLRIMPFLVDSPIFEEYAIFGDLEICCGEVYYRMGALSKVWNNCRFLESRFEQIGVREITCYCQACYNMLANILPSLFQARFPFKPVYFGDKLFQDVRSGKITTEKYLKGLKVTVQDPCHSKLLGREFQTRPRAILENLGATVVEMKHNHEFALCCGLGHGAARYNPLDMAKGIIRRLIEARKTGADRLVVYCNSCYLLFSIGNLLTPWRIPVYHINELVSEAAGSPLPRLAEKRARQMLGELFIRGMPKVISSKRVTI